ncbi:hypothetical protein BDP27DRAFT_1313591 [Rhodocollybia butyracea]|uniref:Phosphotransferase n=1 Tax=Rhodocollybia butyracea TaxID=206335 RepID=A0A9P5UEV1_9AGAR|nr:hypothetical protein BDP27DRAFT_1313591 [Rhodocollybia butyracea]
MSPSLVPEPVLPSPQSILDDIHARFQLGYYYHSSDQIALTSLTQVFVKEFAQGLEKYGEDMAMVPTYVTGVPDGSETGTFLSLDLGGTNLRVCQVTLLGNKSSTSSLNDIHTLSPSPSNRGGEFELRQQKYKVSETLKGGEASVLFDYLADSVDAFLTMHPPESPSPEMHLSASETEIGHGSAAIPLGLTFSFPVSQTSLDSGEILTWTKGFSAKNAIGKDVVRLLQDAFDRKHIHVKCVALVNDTVGALLSRAYTSGGCILGAIFGTGTNGAYVEKISRIPKLQEQRQAQGKGASRGKQEEEGEYMVVNTEWGAFNNSRTHLPTTPYDATLDRTSINPRFQAFEKFISGMYLGELTRIVLVSLIDAFPYSSSNAVLFKGKVTPTLNTQWGLDTSVLSEIEVAWAEGVGGRAEVVLEHDNPVPNWESLTALQASHISSDANTQDKRLLTRLERVRQVVVSKLGYEDGDVGLRDAAILRWASHLIARRAALLSGVAVAAVLVQTGRAGYIADSHSHINNEYPKDEKIGVGVDGSLIQFYPHFETHMRSSLRTVVGREVEERVVIGLAKDGSGVGAALCALQALKQGVV